MFRGLSFFLSPGPFAEKGEQNTIPSAAVAHQIPRSTCHASKRRVHHPRLAAAVAQLTRFGEQKKDLKALRVFSVRFVLQNQKMAG